MIAGIDWPNKELEHPTVLESQFKDLRNALAETQARLARASDEGYAAGIEDAAKVCREVQRCTCPPTPREIRTKHERWCPWALADAIRALSPPEPVSVQDDCYIERWEHGCNALCMCIDLWIKRCPHCGMPAPMVAASEKG